MHEHVKRKLRQILGRLDGPERVGHRLEVRVWGVYSYGHELALAVAGIGLSHPLVLAVGGAATPEAPEATAAGALLTGIQSYPAWLAALVIHAVVFWLIVRVMVNQQGLAQKIPLYRACERELGKLRSDLDAALSEEEPMAPLAEVFGKAKEIVDRYYVAGGWPWPVEPPDAEERVAPVIERLMAAYSGTWAAVPDEVQQREPVAAGGRDQ